MSKVEKVVASLTNPAATPPNAADIIALQQSYSNMQAQMKLLVERVDELEARVRTLEAAADPDSAEAAAPKPKPKAKSNPPKLEAPAKP